MAALSGGVFFPLTAFCSGKLSRVTPGAAMFKRARCRLARNTSSRSITIASALPDDALLNEDVVLEGLNELSNEAVQVMLGSKSRSILTVLEDLDEAGEYLVKEGKLDAARFLLVIRGMLNHEVLPIKENLRGPYKKAFDKVWGVVEDAGWQFSVPEQLRAGIDTLDEELMVPPAFHNPR